MQTRRAFLASAMGASALLLAACNGANSGDTEADTNEASTPNIADVEKGEGVMTYDEYVAAAVDDAVVIEAYVQGKQSWWEDKATIYAQDAVGGYFIYNATCSEEDYDKLVEGQKIKVSGFKAEWSGEVEIAEGATIELENGSYIAPAYDATDLLGTGDLVNYQNQKVAFTGMKLEPSEDPDGKEVPFLYNWDGSGSEGDDLYFNASTDSGTYTFTVESYLTDKDSDVYKFVTSDLTIGETYDFEGFLYWYEGPNPHITSVAVA